ncbi:phosphopantetheine-binding protein [Actinomadura yumaensis]
MSLTALDTFPLDVSGKVDLAALPEPTEQLSADDAEHLPDGDVETLIAELWQELLGRERVLANDDFFALGGHSLIALRLAAELKNGLGVVMPTRMVYANPRLRDLARAILAYSDR